ncbi:MAG: DNA cytosine methyltransferase [Caldilineaceae bacterium]|nr:DNA cytosine methyltransferase [Caldilineaceae bacterium]
MGRIPVISFFSGGGFLDLGFEQAGFDVIWSNEVDKSFADMYRAGISSWRQAAGRANGEKSPLVIESSVNELTERTILAQAFGSVPPEFFGIIGGPPCQDFSISGKDLGSEGNRGKLTQTFADLVCDLRPSFFVMENVPGLVRKKHRKFYQHIVSQLEADDLGYLTSMKVLNALEYGVPQCRERLFLIGFRKDILPDERSPLTQSGPDQDWFPWPYPKFSGAKNLAWPTTSPFGRNDIPVPPDIPLQLTVGHLVGDDAEQLPNGLEAFTPYSKKFREIMEGDVSGKSFKRLHRYRYSPTVWYGNNEVHLHPWKPRRLTVREALRIQSVPDEYVLPAESHLTHKFKVISNGVPPLLARQIASALLQYIADKELASGVVAPENRQRLIEHERQELSG